MFDPKAQPDGRKKNDPFLAILWPLRTPSGKCTCSHVHRLFSFFFFFWKVKGWEFISLVTLSSISSDAKKKRRRKKEENIRTPHLWKAKWERFASSKLKHSNSDSPGVTKRLVSWLCADGGYGKIPSINSHMTGLWKWNPCSRSNENTVSEKIFDFSECSYVL